MILDGRGLVDPVVTGCYYGARRPPGMYRKHA
jgi:hypothetical protein